MHKLFSICRLLIFFLFIDLSCLSQNNYTNQHIIDLAGKWRFQADPNDVGVLQSWYKTSLKDNITLPGSMVENMKGDDVTLQTKWTGSIYDSSFFFRPSLAKYRQPGNIKIPFWLTPNKHYVGVAWYQREIDIPANWNKKRITLFLERCHIQTRVWVDDKEIGSNNSLVAAHEFVITRALLAGKHTITIRIDNSIKDTNVGPDSHSVTDHTQGNWNGIVGKMLLKATSPVYLDNVQIYPDIKNKVAKVNVTIINADNRNAAGKIVLSANSFNTKIAHVVQPVSVDYKASANDTTIIDVNLYFGNKMLLWDEFDPVLYMLIATITSQGNRDEKQVQFGMREIKAVGQAIEVNGRKVYLRGNLNNCEFPLTGYAPMDVDSWKRIYSIAKSHGLNHLRFHSWCPPEAAFIAADEAGFYIQPEGPTWPNHRTSLGDGRFIDRYLYEETGRILKAYGNHPSFCMLAAGNEPAGRNQAKYLGEYVTYWREKDNRRLYTGASVAMSWPLYPESDYMIKSGPRGLNWNNIRPETISDYHAAVDTFKVPYVTHEMGQWCVFPDFKEIKKYTGVTRAKNFELFREDLSDHGMAGRAEDFLMASGKLQALCYKQEIEKSLRTKNGAGFQLLGLQDFPGQGTALIGVLNAFWQEKGYLTAKEWSRFCNATVPVSRIEKFTYTNDEVFAASIEVYHYGKTDLRNAMVTWTVKDEGGKIIQSGRFPSVTISTGGNTEIGKIRLPLAPVKQASKLNLEVKIDNTPFANDWNFWVYPKTLPAPASKIYYTDTLDTKAEEILNKGGTVFLHAAGKVIKGKEVVSWFTPVFWNTSWFKMKPPHTLGISLNPDHPAFHYFPTSYHSDLQWWEIVNKAQVMHLEDFPQGFRPLVQPIDTWFMNRKLGLVVEAKAGRGKIMISSADLFTDTVHRVAARQLLYSLQQYMASEEFDPEHSVDIKVLRDLFITPSKETWDSFTKAVPDELKPQNQQK
jgi:hypothetical protein